MHTLRGSSSMDSQSEDGNEGEHRGLHRESHSHRICKHRPSLDTFLIPGRIRYPSAKVPEPTDHRIARSLLSFDALDVSKSHWGHAHEHTRQEERRFSFSTEYASLALDRSSSGFSGLYFSDISSGSGTSSRSTSQFVAKYNDLAHQNGLKEIQKLEPTMATTTGHDHKTSTAPRRSLFDRLLHKCPIGDKDATKPRLPHKRSVISLLAGSSSKSSIARESLDDIYRLSGISILHLPPAFRAVSLAIPTCLAATGNYIAEHGHTNPGVFRIPGQVNVIDAIYNHYATRMKVAEATSNVQAAIGSSSLPAIACSMSDVASVFKKMLRDISGGILGSLTLYHELQEISDVSRRACIASGTRPRLIALALLSLKSELRLSLICAVFGLLAYLKRNTSMAATGVSDCVMTTKAFAIVFAPLLVGDLNEQIETNEPVENHVLSASHVKKGILGLRKTTRSAENGSLTLGMERMSAASVVIEYMIEEWLPISRLMREYNSSPPSNSLASWRRIDRRSHESRVSSGASQQLKFGRDPFSPTSGLLGPCTQPRPGLKPWSRSPPSLPPTQEEPMEDITVLQRSERAHSVSSSDGFSSCGSRSGLREVDGLVVSDTIASTESRTQHEEAHADQLCLEHFTEGFCTEGAFDLLPPNTSASGDSSIQGHAPKSHAIGELDQLPEATGAIEATMTTATTQHDADMLQQDPCPRTPSTRFVLEHGVPSRGLVMALEDADQALLVESEETPCPMTPSVHIALAHTVPRRRLRLAPQSADRVLLVGACNRPYCSAPSRIPRPTTFSEPRHGYASRVPALTSTLASSPSPPKNRVRALRQIMHLAAKDEPPAARCGAFKASSSSPALGYVAEPHEALVALDVGSKKLNVGMLYAEISRLKSQLDALVEENVQLRHELDTSRSLRISGTLSDQLRSAERDARVWKRRAEWAEASLFGKGRKKKVDQRSENAGDAHR